MAKGISTRLTSAQDARAMGRKFGLTVGTAFIVLSGIVYWSGNPTVATVLAAIGGLLVLGALMVPAQLLPVERAWMALAHVMSKVTTPIVMGILYFVVFTPVGLVRRALGKNALVHANTGGGYWSERPAGQRGSDLDRQF